MGGFMKKIVKIGLCLLILLSISGCYPVKETEGNLTIAMIPKLVGIPYFDQCAKGAEAAAEGHGMTLIYKGPTTADAASQVNIIQDMIYKNVDVIAIAPIDPEAVRPMLNQARSKGIIVVTYDADAAVESRDVFVNQVSALQLSEHMMDNMARLLGGKGQYAILTASMTADNQNTWIESMTAYQKATYADMELLTVIPNDEDQQKAYANTRNLIQAYPELDGLFAMSTVVGPGAAEAVDALGMNGEVKLYVLSHPNDIRQYIKSGAVQIGTLWNPSQLGALTVEVAARLVKGETITNGETIGGIGPLQYDEEDNVVIIGEILDFTVDNIDDYDF